MKRPLIAALLTLTTSESVGEPPFGSSRGIIPEVMHHQFREIRLTCGNWPVTYNTVWNTVIYGTYRGTDARGTRAAFSENAIDFPLAADTEQQRATMRIEWDSLRYSVFLQQNIDDRESAAVVISQGTCMKLP